MNDTTFRKENTKLGFIGLGLMGSRFLMRLLACGSLEHPRLESQPNDISSPQKLDIRSKSHCPTSFKAVTCCCLLSQTQYGQSTGLYDKRRKPQTITGI